MSSDDFSAKSASEQCLLLSEQANNLLKTGSQALKLKHYAQSVEALEKFCHGTAPSTKNYSQAQMWLVKAYHGNEQLEEAIALCQQLLTNEKEIVQSWARQYLLNLAPATVPETASSQSETQTPTTVDKAANASIELKTLSEFKNFYQKNLLAELKAIEAKRQAALNQIIIATIIILVILGALVKFFPISLINFNSRLAFNSSLLITFFFLLLFVGFMWFWIAFYSSSTENYASGFKEKIIQSIINFVDQNKVLCYVPYTDASSTLFAFKHSQLFSKAPASIKITQNDCVFGKISETNISFSQIYAAEVHFVHPWLRYLSLTHLANTFLDFYIILPVYIFIFLVNLIIGIPFIVRRIIKGQRLNSHEFTQEVLKNDFSKKSLFKGIFFRAEFNKKFQSKLIILPAILNSRIGFLNKDKGQVIKLEDPEFNNFFVVYGYDQVEARYLLSTNLMNKLVKFRKKANRNIYISFVESMIYIAIDYQEDLFEPKLFNTMLSFKPIQEYFEIFQLMLGVVEELNLNRYIWEQ